MLEQSTAGTRYYKKNPAHTLGAGRICIMFQPQTGLRLVVSFEKDLRVGGRLSQLPR